jgi:hypothetical protein
MPTHLITLIPTILIFRKVHKSWTSFLQPFTKLSITHRNILLGILVTGQRKKFDASGSIPWRTSNVSSWLCPDQLGPFPASKSAGT